MSEGEKDLIAEMLAIPGAVVNIENVIYADGSSLYETEVYARIDGENELVVLNDDAVGETVEESIARAHRLWTHWMDTFGHPKTPATESTGESAGQS